MPAAPTEDQHVGGGVAGDSACVSARCSDPTCPHIWKGVALGRHEDHPERETERVYRRNAIVSDTDLQEAARKLAGTYPGTRSTASLDSPSSTAQILDGSR